MAPKVVLAVHLAVAVAAVVLVAILVRVARVVLAVEAKLEFIVGRRPNSYEPPNCRER